MEQNNAKNRAVWSNQIFCPPLVTTPLACSVFCALFVTTGEKKWEEKNLFDQNKHFISYSHQHRLSGREEQ